MVNPLKAFRLWREKRDADAHRRKMVRDYAAIRKAFRRNTRIGNHGFAKIYLDAMFALEKEYREWYKKEIWEQ